MQHLATTILTQRDFCADAKSKTAVKGRKCQQRTMDSCGLKDVLESHKKKDGGWMCGRVETGLLVFVIHFQNKAAGNLHCSFSCEAPGSLSSQPAHSADPTPASPSPAAWQTTRLLIMHVNTSATSNTQSKHKIIHYVSRDSTHNVWNSGEGTAVHDCCWRTGGKKSGYKRANTG